MSRTSPYLVPDLTLASKDRPSRIRYLFDLLRELVLRDVNIRYKRSAIGWLWSILNPLIQMFVLTFVFRRVLPLDIQNYPLFVFTGLLAWSWFSSSVVQAATVITDNGGLVRRPGFPVTILPMVCVGANLMHFVFSLPILLIFILMDGPPSPTIVFLPMIVASQFVLCLGIGYLVATLQVIFNDTKQLLSVAIMLAFYLTPVFYPRHAVPEQYLLLYQINPMVHLIGAYRAIFMDRDLPDFAALGMVTCVSIIVLLVGHALFVRTSWRFAEEL